MLDAIRGRGVPSYYYQRSALVGGGEFGVVVHCRYDVAASVGGELRAAKWACSPPQILAVSWPRVREGMVVAPRDGGDGGLCDACKRDVSMDGENHEHVPGHDAVLCLATLPVSFSSI